MKPLLLLSAVALASTPALAVTAPRGQATIGGIDGGAQGFMTSHSATRDLTFDDAIGCDQTLLSAPGVTTTGNVLISPGSTAVRTEPGGNDTSCYASIGTSRVDKRLVAGTVDVSGAVIGGAINYLGLYWGSVDTYNSITFLDANGKPISVFNGVVPLGYVVTGKSLARVFGLNLLYPAQSVFVNFDFSAPVYSILFKSTNDAFEFDNVAISTIASGAARSTSKLFASRSSLNFDAVPEPEIASLFGLAFTMIVYSRRRRSA